MCLCIIHENVNLLLDVLSNEITGLKNNLGESETKMVCDENHERCMMSHCNNCKRNFVQHIIQKVIDKNKVIKWYQWTNCRGRAEKKEFSGRNKLSIWSFTTCARYFL